MYVGLSGVDCVVVVLGVDVDKGVDCVVLVDVLPYDFLVWVGGVVVVVILVCFVDHWERCRYLSAMMVWRYWMTTVTRVGKSSVFHWLGY